ncbi:uncharacterized protein LOC132953807 [Metopolophium dirhodum]|uniref:uncharacterized protein LOC132953807 n=1 Tax=Metopolophium dirhodum TaxID=44670 RepID=UPI002990081C|nr:uncharacterized protein LOC132953807 [Metopolophium dirhodum]
MPRDSKYKYCFVSKCTNTSTKCPNKRFLSVPYDAKRRLLWFKVARRNDTAKSKTHHDCCEDHFVLEDDLDNYIQFKLMGASILKLKKNIVPHIFDCQVDRKQALTSNPRPLHSKRIRKNIIDTAIQNQSCMTEEHIDTVIPDAEIIIEDFQQSDKQTKEIGIQVNLNSKTVPKSTRSKGTQCDISVEFQTENTIVDKLTLNVNKSNSKTHECTSMYGSTSSSNSESELDTSMDISINSFSSISHTNNEQKKFKDMSYEMTCFYIKNKPKAYIGLNPDWYNQGFVVGKSETYKLKSKGEIFEPCGTPALICFVPDVVSLIRTLKQRSERYSDVQSIIDCLEIEIPKPSNPIEQSLTWSDYKKCNTLKYLISSTPDGFINFISEGYGGRSSDALLVEKSGYLECLPENCTVMADRGFKSIDFMLEKRVCKLVRPPSVFSNKKSTKEEVLETKRIASLRIHIERFSFKCR